MYGQDPSIKAVSMVMKQLYPDEDRLPDLHGLESFQAREVPEMFTHTVDFPDGMGDPWTR